MASESTESSNGSGSDLELVTESMNKIHECVEQLSHISKHLYSRALRVQQLTENPDLDLWTEQFKLHERSYKWAKKHMVPRSCSLWQVHETLLNQAKKEKRIHTAHKVRLAADEAAILDLPANEPVPVWTLLGRLPRFFL